MMGGVKFYVTDANNAQVTDLSDQPLARSDIDDMFQEFFYTVGSDKAPKTLLVSAWAKRKISSFYAGTERNPSQPSGAAGVVVDRLNTDFGVVELMMHQSLAKDEILALRKENIQIGHHGKLGRPQLRLLPPSTVGPRSQKVFYGDISEIVAGVQGMGRIHNFATDS
jgi:hypothetical protein